MTSSATARAKEKPVRILMLTKQGGLLSENMKSQLALIEAKGNCNIERIEESDEEKIASEIKQGNYDLVLINEGITSSAWKIIDLVSKPSESVEAHQKPKKFPRFYLDGSVDKIVDNEIKHTQFSGVVEVAKEGKMLFKQSYGHANQSTTHAVENEPNKKVVIASITKLFTAVAVAKLAEEGKIQFDDPISKFLPDTFPNKQYFIDKNITIKELLMHTSGLGQFQAEKLFKEKILDFTSLDDYTPMLTAEESKSIFHPDDGPQNNFRYSNINYLMLGLAIQQASGKDFHRYLQEDVFPAEMKDTTHTRHGDQSFALSHATFPESIQPPSWLHHVSDSDQDELSKIAINARNYLNQYNEKMLALISSYQNGLAEINTEDDLSKFKSKFKEALKQAFKMFDDIREGVKIELEKLKKMHGDDLTPDIKERIKQLEKLLMDISNNLSESSFTGAPTLLYSWIIDLSIAVPAGYFRSTADDLIVFQEALWNGRILKSPEVLLSEAVALPSSPSNLSHYCYGTCVWNDGKPMEAVGHDGCAPGAFSTLRTYPNANGMAVATLSNVENKDVFTPVKSIEEHLISSIVQDTNIQYFDANINPDCSTMLARDIQAISSARLNSFNRSSRVQFFQQREESSEFQYNTNFNVQKDHKKSDQKPWAPTVAPIQEEDQAQDASEIQKKHKH